MYGLNKVKQDFTRKNFEKVYKKFYLNTPHTSQSL